MLYNQTFISQSLVRHVTKNVKISCPMMTNRQKVLQAIIRWPGIVVNVHHMVKNIRKIMTQTAKGIYDFFIFTNHSYNMKVLL